MQSANAHTHATERQTGNLQFSAQPDALDFADAPVDVAGK